MENVILKIDPSLFFFKYLFSILTILHTSQSSHTTNKIMQSTINSDFALLHNLSTETLRTILDLAPQLSPANSSIVHPASAIARTAIAQECYKLRYEAAENRYARMKGLVSASFEAQQRMERENVALRVADTVVHLGLDNECSAILSSMRGAADGKLLLDEVAELVKLLNSTVKQNESLMRMNRELRGEQFMDEDRVVSGLLGPNQDSFATTTAEVETLRKHITALELECTRLQTDSSRFESDERLRECEDVFDRVIGRQRQDSAPEDGLRRYHPIGTCTDPACIAYARRLRGGLRSTVTDAYVRERIVRINGLVRQKIEPLETLRAQKDAEIRALRERIQKFEQSMRMTSEEADQIELRAVSMEILDKATQLAKIKSDCVVVEKEYLRRREIVARLAEEEQGIHHHLREAQMEMQRMAEERQMTVGVTNDFRDELVKLEKMRAEIAVFKSGKAGEALKKQKKDAANLAIEIENLRIERSSLIAEEEEEEFVAMPQASTTTTNEGGAGAARTKKRNKKLEILPSHDGTAIFRCICDQLVPIAQFNAHVQAKHATQGRHPLICGAGCGVFIINRPLSDLESHVRSGECARRVAEIQRLMAGHMSV